MRERLGKAFFFLPQDRLDGLSRRSQLRVGIAHFPIKSVNKRMKEQVLRTQLMTVAHGAAGDPSQHVAAPLVTGDYAINHEERTGTDMVCNDPKARRYEIGGPCGLARRGDQCLKEVDFII